MNRKPRTERPTLGQRQCRRHGLMCLAVAILATTAASGARAATWIVAADGSQRFLTIQDALDFSAPGDTVLVYPGRYDTGRWINTGYGAASTLGSLAHDDVVLRGTSQAQVILGPAQAPASGRSQDGLMLSAGTGGQRIENLTLENLRLAISASGDVTVSDVSIRQCDSGIEMQNANDAIVERCTIDGVSRGIEVHASERIWVRGCTFGGNSGGVFAHSVHGWARVDRCSMLGVAWGVEAQAGSVLEVLDTQIQAAGSGVWLTSGYTHATLTRNRIDGGDVALWVGEQCAVDGTRNVFLAGSYTTLMFQSGATAQLVDNHIFLQSSKSVWLRYYGSGPPTVRLDLTGNYWGSATEAQIAARVWDGVDDPTMNAFVDFLPIAGAPVPASTVSFGELKAGFTGP